MVLIAALIFWFPARGLESPPPAVEQAQAMAVRKNRTEACAILRRALAGTPGGPARTRLRETLNQISRVFFTDKGQRAFETGQSVLFENPAVAIPHLRESLALEDGNVLVRTTLASAHVARNELDAAAAEIATARALNPHDGDVAVMDLRILIAEQKFGLFRERAKTLPPLEPFADAIVRYLQAREASHAEQGARAIELLTRVVADYPTFPEARYYLARADLSHADAHVRKYVNQCRALTGRDRRTFALEPRLCSHLKEAEDELLKKSTDI